MIPELPGADFSNTNGTLILKVSNLILKNYPCDSAPVTIFSKNLDELASSSGLSTEGMTEQIENLYKLWAFLIYHHPKEAEFREYLTKVNIEKVIADKMVELWLNDGQQTVERVSIITSTGLPRVTGVHSSTQVNLSKKDGSRDVEVVLHLGTTKGPRKMTLNRDEAVTLYNEFHKIQETLDKLVE